jgi:hypothetical protein
MYKRPVLLCGLFIISGIPNNVQKNYCLQFLLRSISPVSLFLRQVFPY